LGAREDVGGGCDGRFVRAAAPGDRRFQSFAPHDNGVDGIEEVAKILGALFGHVKVVHRTIGPGDTAIERDGRAEDHFTHAAIV
jgi:hypothetical protein